MKTPSKNAAVDAEIFSKYFLIMKDFFGGGKVTCDRILLIRATLTLFYTPRG
jgi:hypothetical protein